MNNCILNIDRLIECRERMGYSKLRTAREVGLSQPAYLRYESGERIPSIHVIKEIAKVLNTSVEYLTNISDSSDINTYVIEASTDAQLFELVQIYNNIDSSRQARLFEYAKKLL